MTIANFKRRYPSLIRRVERSTRMKFLKKPTLKLEARRGNLKCPSKTDGKRRKGKVVRASVHLTKKVVREDPKLAEALALYELRLNLIWQKGKARSGRQAHRFAEKYEEGDRKRLGLKKSVTWLTRQHMGLEKGEGIVQKAVK